MTDYLEPDLTEGAIRYPNIKARLVGQDGNAFNLLGIMQRALRKNNVSPDEINAFTKEATSGDYDHLLATCTRWVDVE